MATVRDSVADALRELNVLAAGEDATAQDAADGMAALNDLIDEWAGERLQIYTVTRSTWTIVSGTGTYTVGTGGTVNIARPVYVENVKFQDTSQTPVVEYPLDPLTDEEYQDVMIKTMTSSDPTDWYYNPTFPLGSLTFWPVPSSSTLQGVIYAATAVAQFTGLTDAVALPPGYRRMIRKNLAVELAPSYGRQVDPVLFRQAIESKENVKRSNTRLADLGFEAAALIGSHGSGYNIFTDR